MRLGRTVVAVLFAGTTLINAQAPAPAAQSPKPGAQPPKPSSQPPASNLQTAIGNLGKFEAPVRVAASRDVRRAPAAQAVPALIAAARDHADGYVRFRALVLLAGFNDSRAREVMSAALDEPNDRLRTAARIVPPATPGSIRSRSRATSRPTCSSR